MTSFRVHGGRGGQKVSDFGVRTLWMVPRRKATHFQIDVCANARLENTNNFYIPEISLFLKHLQLNVLFKRKIIFRIQHYKMVCSLLQSSMHITFLDNVPQGMELFA